MALLITGGTGFVGGRLVEELVNQKERWGIQKEDVFVLVRQGSKTEHLKRLGVNLIEGDLTDLGSLKKAVKDKELVFHLGAVVLDQSDPEILQKVNVEGTRKLLMACQSEPKMRKFVFVSTWGVYGYKIKVKKITENQPFNPTNDYHKSKAEAETIVWKTSKESNFSVAVVRLPMILGPGDTLTAPRVIQAFFEKKVKMIGNGKNLYSGVHVADAAEAILTIGFNKKSDNQVYNVKSFDITQRDYWRAHMEAINYPGKIAAFPKWLAMLYAWTKEIGAKIKGEGKPTLSRHRVMRYGNTRILDIAKLEEELGWKPRFTDGVQVIKEAVHWLIANEFIDIAQKKVVLLRRWEDSLKRKKDEK